jgi:hypothetical protein
MAQRRTGDFTDAMEASFAEAGSGHPDIEME